MSTASDRPAIKIASSGMLHAGPAYVRAWLPYQENAVFVVGDQDAERPGKQLLELQQGGTCSSQTGEADEKWCPSTPAGLPAAPLAGTRR